LINEQVKGEGLEKNSWSEHVCARRLRQEAPKSMSPHQAMMLLRVQFRRRLRRLRPPGTSRSAQGEQHAGHGIPSRRYILSGYDRDVRSFEFRHCASTDYLHCVRFREAGDQRRNQSDICLDVSSGSIMVTTIAKKSESRPAFSQRHAADTCPVPEFRPEPGDS